MTRRMAFSLLVSLAVCLPAGATVTYTVGSCKPKMTNFSTISAALAATPPPDIVQVCPGTYQEQVVITLPVILQGITIANSSQAVIAPPSGGLVTNATDDNGNSWAAQLWVNNASGAVSISHITLDGGNPNCVSNFNYLAMFIQNSAATVTQVLVQNTACGNAILLEGGSANPTVTVQNSTVRNFGGQGIWAETNAASPEITTVIKGNSLIETGTSVGEAIFLDKGSMNTVSGNVITDTLYGIVSGSGATGSATGNTLSDMQSIAVLAVADGVAFKSNRIYNNGIVLQSTVAAVQGNSINTAYTAIDFQCTANPNVSGNLVNNASVGVANVPSALVTSNNYNNVATIRTGGC